MDDARHGAATLSYDIPPIDCPESRLFTYPTRMADAWSPHVEEVVEPACSLHGARLSFRVEYGSTEALRIPPWTRNPLRRARRRGTPLDVQDRMVMDFRDDDTDNYSHLLTNLVPRVLLLQHLLKRRGENRPLATAIVRPSPSVYTTNLLETIGIPWLATDAEVRGQIVFPLSEPATRAHFLFLPALMPSDLSDDVGSPDRLFINRKQSRCLVNEDEVVRFLQDRGFQPCSFEDMAPRLQWTMIRKARQVVAIHGAGMANLLFNRGWAEGAGPNVVEIFPAGFKVTYFRYLTACIRGRWCGIRSQVTPGTVRDVDEKGLPLKRAFESIRVHVESLAAALEYVHSGGRD